MEFKVGDIVAYRAAFLKSIGWNTNVPHDGKVITAADDPAWPIVEVQWCNDKDGETMRIKTSNLILKSKLHLDPA